MLLSAMAGFVIAFAPISTEQLEMDHRLDVTEMTDEELRTLCLAAVYICISWIDQTEDPLWSEVADEAYRRGWLRLTSSVAVPLPRPALAVLI